MSNKLFILEDFSKSIERLREILILKKNAINRDSAIKRFELCFDLSWKSIKIYAKIQGVECYSPRSCFKTAFQLKLFEYDKRWLKMIDDRNLSTHVYHEELADQVYESLPLHLSLFENLYSKLNEAAKNIE